MTIDRLHNRSHKRMGLAIVGLAMASGLTGCQGSNGRLAERLRNQPAPDFALDDLDGKTVRLSELRGKPIVLVFFGHG